MAQTAQKLESEQNEDCAGAPATHGSFCWNELLTHDPARARKFYADTIGWTFDPMPMQDGGTYWVAKAGDKMVGGHLRDEGPGLRRSSRRTGCPISPSMTSTRG